MMIRKNILFWLCFNAFVSTAQSPPDLSDPTWELFFYDDFNDGTVDLTKWYRYNEFDHYGADVVHLAENVSESGGNMIITFNKETYTCTLPGNQCDRQEEFGIPYDYTSGFVATKPAYDFKYGYIETRMKVSYHYGLWPALWTFKGWTVSSSLNAAEIDMVEILLGEHYYTDTVTFNLHYTYDDINTPENENTPEPTAYEKIDIGNFNNVYITYGLEWNPNEIIWYINGVPRKTFSNHEIHDKVKYIISLAVQHGALGPNESTPTVSNMYIDYVKIYQQHGQCALAYNACNFDYNTYESTVKKGIVIGGVGCSSSLPINANLYLNAVETVLINGEFTVPLGAAMTVQIEPDCYIVE